MLDHLLNVSYLLYALTLIAINPIFTAVFATVIYMRGEMAAINAVFVQGFTSLAAISVYIIPLAMIGGLISYIVSGKLRKQDD